MKKILLVIPFLAFSYVAKAQSTIVINGEATVTIEGQTTTVKCDRFYQTTCMTITSPGPVIVKSFARVEVYKDERPVLEKSGVVKNYDVKEGSNGSEHRFTFEK